MRTRKPGGDGLKVRRGTYTYDLRHTCFDNHAAALCAGTREKATGVTDWKRVLMFHLIRRRLVGGFRTQVLCGDLGREEEACMHIKVYQQQTFEERSERSLLVENSAEGFIFEILL